MPDEMQSTILAAEIRIRSPLQICPHPGRQKWQEPSALSQPLHGFWPEKASSSAGKLCLAPQASGSQEIPVRGACFKRLWLTDYARHSSWQAGKYEQNQFL